MAPPRSPEAQNHLDLGLAYLEMGLVDDAVAELELVLDLEPENPEARAALVEVRVRRGADRSGPDRPS